ncbi:PRC-barrel domain-containing protein [Micromonosporaceae bacterium B7E4]
MREVLTQLGAKISYLALPVGTAVYDRDGGRVGVVEHVLDNEDEDIFHGIILQTSPPYRRHLFALYRAKTCRTGCELGALGSV